MMDVQIRDLRLAYTAGGHTVRPVDGLDLDVHDGETVLLHGPSGCGKTTLLSAIGGLLTPESGSLLVGGVDVASLTGSGLREHRQRRVGVVFQAFNLIPSLDATENVMAPLLLAGWSRKAARQRARQLLEQVGLGHRLEHRPAGLSGGQQQRVAIARALAADPPVILADEPTAHLDHEQVDAVRDLLAETAGPGRVVLIATHDDRLAPVADRIVHLTAASPSRRTGVAA
jgi:putative ABC transport system ATP-binding protein